MCYTFPITAFLELGVLKWKENKLYGLNNVINGKLDSN